ncbi:MAG: PQQ-dependent sugar dehydrogenase [Pirellulaceae bacterium]
MIIAWPSAGHDGGGIMFDKAGVMYLSAGDGSSTSDEHDTGQRLDDLPGSILRIDVDHVQANQAYSIPADNPFVGQENVRPEIYAYGLRNPWRLTYDIISDQLWTGINGQDLWESAQLVRKGENYGWPIMEANHPFQLERQIGPGPIVRNTVEHPHSESRSLTGGFVYRGSLWPELQGAYLYGDYETGNIWAVKHDGQQVVWQRHLAATRIKITCFTPGLNGEILVVDHQGKIYRLIDNAQAKSAAAFPVKLSESGLFENMDLLQPQPGVWPYRIRASRWADGATAVRHVGIPGVEQAKPKQNKAWVLPEASVLAKTYSLPVWDEATKMTRLRKVETQVLTKQAGEWAGYSYRWNAEQTDAELVPAEGATSEWIVQQRDRVEPIRWRFHSRNECIVCHNREIEYVIGFTTSQLDCSTQISDTTMSQLQYFQDIGLATDVARVDPDDSRHLQDPYQEDGDLAQRARSYLHVNCRPCHAREAGGNATIDLDIGSNPERMKLFGERPMHGDFGLRDAALVVSGHPERSVLYYRLAKLGPGRMPYAGSSSSDVDGIKLIYDWIQSLPGQRLTPPLRKRLTLRLRKRLTSLSAVAMQRQIRTNGAAVIAV